MKQLKYDIIVIGGGPAGMAAAIEAKKQGASKVAIIERDMEMGGILQQCIHDGFGIHRFNERLSGSEYAQRFIDEIEDMDIEVFVDTMVLEITTDRKIYTSGKEGVFCFDAGAIILAMGCRERTASQVQIFGSRPVGVMTAGTAQRYINMEGYIPGTKAVILGSGDIGLIMARRMKQEGIEVLGVYEVMPEPGGLTRNIVQCLDDYDIPLHLSTTVSKVHGMPRVEGVTVVEVDENRQQKPETEKYIECDLLVLAVGLIPENELSHMINLEIDPMTQGPVIDQWFMTSVPGIFAAGNVAAVFDLVDYVSESGEIAARGAVNFINGELKPTDKYQEVSVGDNIRFVIPQRINPLAPMGETQFFMRVKEKRKTVNLVCATGQEEVYSKRQVVVAPPEMLSCRFNLSEPIALELKIQEVAK